MSATNDEKDETVSFSISRGLDSHLFDIDETTGSLTFLSAPDYETPLDNGADNFYEVIVMATDTGTNPGYDEQNITIEIEDGAEPPSFDSNTSTTYEISEDTILWSHVIIATDDAGNDLLVLLPTHLVFQHYPPMVLPTLIQIILFITPLIRISMEQHFHD